MVCLNTIRNFWKTKNDTVGKSAISGFLGNMFYGVLLLVLGGIVFLIRFTYKNIAPIDKDIKHPIVNTKGIISSHSTINNIVVSAPVLNGNNSNPKHSASDLSVPKFHKYLQVSSNLADVDKLLENRLSKSNIVTNTDRIEIDFSLYPGSKLQYAKKNTLARLDTGAIVKFQIKGTDCSFYIEGLAIQEIQTTSAEPVLKKIDRKMAEIVRQKMEFVCDQLKKCLQKHD